jgi:hypothetical protein
LKYSTVVLADAGFNAPTQHAIPPEKFSLSFCEGIMKQLDIYSGTIIRHQQEATARHLRRQHRISAALAHPERVRRERILQPALMLVGRRLVIWGMRLQRLTPEPVAPAPSSEVALAAHNK